jgi:hypothetical protein
MGFKSKRPRDILTGRQSIKLYFANNSLFLGRQFHKVYLYTYITLIS